MGAASPSDSFKLDASNISRRLWVGGKPPFDRKIPFHCLVLCAEEIQPSPDEIKTGGTVARCPLPDAALNQTQINRALSAGKYVAECLSRNQRVLVTCAMGINRSALVAGLALGLVTHQSADQVITRIRIMRDERCLSNEHFVDVLRRYIGDGRRPVAKTKP